MRISDWSSDVCSSDLSAPFQIEQHSLHIGCSFGISLYPADGGDAGALGRAADTAMYDAKENGRGIYRFFTPELNDAAQRRHKLVNDVRLACDRGEFTLDYQPQVSLLTGDRKSTRLNSSH